MARGLRRRSLAWMAVASVLTAGASLLAWEYATLRDSGGAAGRKERPALWVTLQALAYIAAVACLLGIYMAATQADGTEAGLVEFFAVAFLLATLMALALLSSLAIGAWVLWRCGQNVATGLARLGLQPAVPPAVHWLVLATGVWAVVGGALIQADVNRLLDEVGSP